MILYNTCVLVSMHLLTKYVSVISYFRCLLYGVATNNTSMYTGTLAVQSYKLVEKRGGSQSTTGVTAGDATAYEFSRMTTKQDGLRCMVGG